MNDQSESLLSSFWHSLKFSIESASSHEKANQLRSLMIFTNELLLSNRLSDAVYYEILSQLSNDYFSVVDAMTEDNGLNSYTDMISLLTSGKPNDSKKWKVETADLHNICFDKTLKQNKAEPKQMRINLSKRTKVQIGQDSNELTNFKNTVSDLILNTPTETSLKSIPHNQFHNQNNKIEISTSVFKSKSMFGKRKSYDDREEIINGLEKKKNYSSETEWISNDLDYKDFSKSEQRKDNKQVNKNALTTENELNMNNNPFRTARDQLVIDQRKSSTQNISNNSTGYGNSKKSLGTRRNANGRFVPPINQDNDDKRQQSKEKVNAIDSKYQVCEWMKNIDPKIIELIENEIMDHGPEVLWEDIAGLEFAKTTIQEIVIWPMLRPDIFTGLRGPPKGLLLFGPPGTGKTLIGKCIASQSNATFFSISASSLTSKWVGEGEKMVRALFGVARVHQPAVIFIDEIDSLLTRRSDGEHESSRRIKTEFLVQLDGTTCSNDDRILVVGATNRPQELDEAARRRLVKRLYIPLPEGCARRQIVENLMNKHAHQLSSSDYDLIRAKTNGFSGADMANLCREAALGPIRNIRDIRSINADEVRPVNINDFENALKQVRPSVSVNDLQVYVDWNRLYGCGTAVT